ncbi:hypothetical protein LTR10_009495 [Elasticomyces elasticus]|nr:hypothetical protein LTR10_009495 [Elasticomyces elasticus]KAK4971407.1 hypothetical protein LTR42_007135 [Elasticomyces elasticus]
MPPPPLQDTTAAAIFQDSPLLRLAAELRIIIYEYVVKDTTLVSYRQGAMLYTSALGKVCRQVRKEYEKIYKTEAVKHAHQIEMHITNFDHSDVFDTIESSPHHKYPNYSELGESLEPWRKKFLVCSLLTNSFDQSLPEMRRLLERRMLVVKIDGDIFIPCLEYRCVFNQATFDVASAKRALDEAREDWGLKIDCWGDDLWAKFESPWRKHSMFSHGPRRVEQASSNAREDSPDTKVLRV